MKIRHGHISNSSSSSFIIATNREIYDATDVKEMILKTEAKTLKMDEYSSEVKVSELCKLFLHEINKEGRISYDTLLSDLDFLADLGCRELRDEYYNGKGKYSSNERYKISKKYGYDSLEYRKHMEEVNQRNIKFGRDKVEKMRRDLEHKYLYKAEFEDCSGEGSYLEHSDIWNDLTHIRISNH